VNRSDEKNDWGEGALQAACTVDHTVILGRGFLQPDHRDDVPLALVSAPGTRDMPV
jgi:hypothetical protein